MMFLGKLLTALIGNDDVIVDSGLAKKPFCHFVVWKVEVVTRIGLALSLYDGHAIALG